MYQLSATCNSKRNEIAYLKNQIQVLEGFVTRLEWQSTEKNDAEWRVCALAWPLSFENKPTDFEVKASR